MRVQMEGTRIDIIINPHMITRVVEVNHDEAGREVWDLAVYLSGREKPYIKKFDNYGERFRALENLERVWQHKQPLSEPKEAKKSSKESAA